jgi:hypothetical protein
MDFVNGREGIVKDITRNIYLAGPIFDCDDRDVFLWRNHASSVLEDRGWNVVDPAISEDFRGREKGIEKKIVKHDMELAHSHAVVGSVDEAIDLLAGWYP